MKILKCRVRSIRMDVMAAGIEPEVVDETKNHKREKDLDATKKKQHLKRSRSSKSLNSKKKSSCSTKAMSALLALESGLSTCTSCFPDILAMRLASHTPEVAHSVIS